MCLATQAAVSVATGFSAKSAAAQQSAKLRHQHFANMRRPLLHRKRATLLYSRGEL